MKLYLGILFFLLILCPCFLNGQIKSDTLAKGNKHLTRQERLRKKHETWDSCFIVKAKGDTIYGRVNHRDDQSTLLSSYISDVVIFFTYQDDKEEQFIPNNIKELYVYNLPDGFKHYVVLDDEYYLSNYGILYRVVVDGPCKLVADRVKNSLPGLFNALQEAHYYLLYKKKFTSIKVEIDASGVLPGLPQIKISDSLKNKCVKAFADCPALVQQIEDKTFHSQDLREIVSEFNRCVGEK